MTREDDLLRLVVAAHALARMAAIETANDAPSAQWRTLKLLREHGAQRLGDLATLSRVSQPGMTRLVGQMAQAGLVSREPDPSDARVQIVGITEEGSEALDVWLSQLRGALAPHFASLSDDGWATIGAAADTLDAATRVPAVTR
ncbi:MarR family winged helix-turn-helix transcriptional regulator [Microbacterium sp. NPDC091313]